MEKIGNFECKTIISELTQGKELANQLKSQLHPAKSREACGFLVEKIVSSYENALSLLNCMAMLGETSSVSTAILESPNFLSGSPTPRSEGFDPFSKDQDQREVSKKRKILPKWSEEVRVFSGTGVEGPLDDGYNWRKYGQKDILGANFPRAYYRCTHRHTQGCLATKQVQRSDEDPSIFEVNYRGRHTCMQERVKQNKEDVKMEEDSNHKHSKKKVMSKEPSFKIETSEVNPKKEVFSSFTFPSTLTASDDLETQSSLKPATESNFTESHSPPFISPATSDCNYISESLCQMNEFWVEHNLQSSESDFTDIISTPTSVSNSPFGEWDFTTDPVEFDANFSLETSEYF